MTPAPLFGKHFTPEQFFREVLNISLRQGRRIIARKEIGIVRIGRTIRIPAEEAERFLASRFESPMTQGNRQRQYIETPGDVVTIVDGVIGRQRRGVR